MTYNIVTKEENYVDKINIECSPIEWLLIKTALELLSENTEISQKDIRKVKSMLDELQNETQAK